MFGVGCVVFGVVFGVVCGLVFGVVCGLGWGAVPNHELSPIYS